MDCISLQLLNRLLVLFQITLPALSLRLGIHLRLYNVSYNSTFTKFPQVTLRTMSFFVVLALVFVSTPSSPPYYQSLYGLPYTLHIVGRQCGLSFALVVFCGLQPQVTCNKQSLALAVLEYTELHGIVIFELSDAQVMAKLVNFALDNRQIAYSERMR